jgi:methionyl-tRNA formyltransferase
MPLRAVFFGTPEFAIPSLAAMLEAGLEVPLVLTQPDRPAGRHATPRPSPVALAAESRGIPVAKPERLRGNQEILERIRQVAPDAGVVVAYGKLLPSALLEVPRLSFVNVHASLLPKYRGASPVQAAILAGDRETGVVTMKIVEELDAGPIYLERRVPIGEREDAGSLSGRLAVAGAQILIETLRGLEAGTLQARPQTGEPSFCRPIRREQGEADWTLPAAALEGRLRAYTPWPGLFTFLGNERIKIVSAGLGPGGRKETPGTFWTEGGKLLAAAGEGTSLELGVLQRAGRRVVSGADFALGVEIPGRFDPAASTHGS